MIKINSSKLLKLTITTKKIKINRQIMIVRLQIFNYFFIFFHLFIHNKNRFTRFISSHYFQTFLITLNEISIKKLFMQIFNKQVTEIYESSTF